MKSYNNCIKLLLVLAAGTTIAYLLMLGRFNSLTLDDYIFSVDLSHYLPWQWTKQMYMTWQGRFSTFFVSGYIFNIWGHASSLFSWTVLHLLIGYFVIGLIIRDVAKVREVWLCIPLAILIANITIMSVFEFSTFYWLCCAGYFLVIYATILLIFVLFFSQWRAWINWTIAIICAVYVSGSAENYTPLVLMVLGIIWLIRIIKGSKADSFVQAFRANRMLFVVCAIIAFGFLIMVMAPGNKVRMQQGDQIVGFMYDFRLMPFLKKTIIANSIFFLRLLSRSLYFLATLPFFVYLGTRVKAQGKEIHVEPFWKYESVATILLLGFLFIAVTACVYGTGYYPPLRAMSFISYVVVVYIGYVGVLLGYKYSVKISHVIEGIVLLACFGWSCFAIYEFQREYPVVKEYHEYVQQRDGEIQKLVNQGNTAPYYAEDYHQPQWQNTYSYLRTFMNRCIGSKKVVNEPYFPYMISVLDAANPQDFKNKGLGDYYNAKFDILTR